ncbi:MAG: 30S ribosomal protein S2 [Candidatus Caenarcaniphilales bacterium]|nr:30S ribosomal protein S2 [Candidatus Caenarcaniphilales bacterium]
MSTTVENEVKAEMSQEENQARADEAKKLLRDLVEAGVHLGHPTKEWNPRMQDYIFASKDGIHVINLGKTVTNLMLSAEFLKKQARLNRNILFVGTSKHSSSVVKEQADRANLFYINQRWLGGLITNFDTIRARLNKLREFENTKETGGYKNYGKKEVARINRQINKLNKSLGGLKKMRGKPEVIVVFDQKKDAIAITESKKVGCALVAITDTNCDPTGIDFVIPGNDDSMRSIELIAKYLTDAILAGQATAKRR